MKVILNKDIPSLGEEGDIKDVARGYARNYLIPHKLVMPYTPDSLAILESRRESIELRRSEKAKAALDVKARLEGEPLVIKMPAGDRGRLFGSVTSTTVVEALAAQGITVERKRIDIPGKTIKSVGATRVRVRLYGDEEAELKIVVEGTGAAAGGSQSRDTSAPDEEEVEASAEADAVASEAAGADTEANTGESEAPEAEAVVDGEDTADSPTEVDESGADGTDAADSDADAEVERSTDD